jgi:hypothetical protein
VLTILYNSTSYAEYRDPTTPAYYSAKTDATSQPLETLNLSAIWVFSHSKRATINGIMAKQGETIFTDIKILRIDKDHVHISQKGSRRKLYLLTQTIKSR